MVNCETYFNFELHEACNYERSDSEDAANDHPVRQAFAARTDGSGGGVYEASIVLGILWAVV